MMDMLEMVLGEEEAEGQEEEVLAVEEEDQVALEEEEVEWAEAESFLLNLKKYQSLFSKISALI